MKANVGINGSENFSKAHRYGVFPSFSIGWVPTEERFMNGTKGWLDHLKLRGSVGWLVTTRESDDSCMCNITMEPMPAPGNTGTNYKPVYGRWFTGR